MQDSRRRLVEILRLQGAQTVDDLAGALTLTRTAVVNHLSALQAEGYVVRRGLRPGTRRPSVVYALTPTADGLFPKQYEEFAAAVLAELKREDATDLKRVLRRIGDRWIARDLPRVEGLRGRERLERVRAVLEDRGFMPTIERGRDGVQLREYNCPVMRLASDHVEVCEMVHRWLEALFGTSLTRTQCLRQGDPYSAYTIAGTRRSKG